MQANPSTPSTSESTKDAITTKPIHPLLRRRWSPRAFAPEPVSAEIITALLEAARWAPSSRNEQPWRFIVATADQPDEHARIAECLTGNNRLWAPNAPVLMVILAKRNFEYKNRPNRTALYDTGAAIAHLTVEATSRNLYVHQMGGIDRDKIRAVYAVPETVEVVVALAIGHLGDAASLPEKFRAAETKPRTRLPLESLIYTN